MPTRCVINFCYDKNNVVAKVYRHSDGYPNTKHGVKASLKKCLEEIERQTKDTRFNDPSYLAAKFLVWQAGQYSQSTQWKTSGGNLDFLSVGIVLENPDDIEYEYFVDCQGTRPKVSYKIV